MIRFLACQLDSNRESVGRSPEIESVKDLQVFMYGRYLSYSDASYCGRLLPLLLQIQELINISEIARLPVVYY